MLASTAAGELLSFQVQQFETPKASSQTNELYDLPSYGRVDELKFSGDSLETDEPRSTSLDMGIGAKWYGIGYVGVGGVW